MMARVNRTTTKNEIIQVACELFFEKAIQLHHQS